MLDKAVAVLAALESGPMTLRDLIEVTATPKATCHRLVTALGAHGLVRRDAQGRFCLGFRLVELGRRAEQLVDVRDLARPVLEELRTATGESVQLYVREGSERVCVLSLESHRELRTIVAEGARLPLDRGSAGKVLGDRWPADERVAESVGERQSGVASVSAPVRDALGNVVAAVSLSGPIDRLGRNPSRKFGAAVRRAAAAIETVAR